MCGELRAGYVLTGTIRRQRLDMRITARLVRTRDGVQIWSDAFNGDAGGSWRWIIFTKPWLLVYGCYMSPAEGFSQARAAIEHGRSLDPGSAELLASEGYLNMYFDWDFEAAQRKLEQAVAANSNYAPAYDWLGVLLTAEQDPGSLPIATDLGFHLHYSGLRELSSLPPAASEWQPLIAARGYAAGVCGQPEQARPELARFERMSKIVFATSYAVALIEAGLGDKDAALMWLRKAIEERSHWLVWLRLDPRFDSLPSDARFEEIAAKVLSHR